MRNRELQSIRLYEQTYRLTIPIQHTYVAEADGYSFVLYQRGTERHMFPMQQQVDEDTHFKWFHVDIAFGEFFTEGDTFDLSIIRWQGDEEKRARIKSEHGYMEFSRLPYDADHIFYPAVTKQGNVSFYIRENFLQAKCTDVHLSGDGVLSVRGMYDDPALAHQDVRNITLVATSNLTDARITIPAEAVRLPDEFGTYDWYPAMAANGFRAAIDVTPYMNVGKEQYWKFYLIVHTEDGEVCESPRIRVNPMQQPFPITKKMKRAGSNITIMCRPTKQSKYLSLKMAAYKWPAERLRQVKRKWIQIRRSNQLLKAYKFTFSLLGKILPANRKLVLFESFHGKQYSDNPRAIYEYMHQHKPEYQLVWSADRRHLAYFADKDVPYVRRFSIRWLLLMTRAAYWVTNARLPLWIPKPNHTTYLQTWHGTPLKRLATDMEEVHMPGTNAKKYKRNFTKEAAKWDYLISPNAYSTAIFRRAFQFPKTMIESGYPRNDYLYKQNDDTAIRRLKAKLGIPYDKKVILYAPTWRDNQFYRKGRYKFELQLDLEKLRETFGDTYAVALRMHYLIAENLDTSGYEDFVYDVSAYEDIRELYLIADVLITDYSSVFFDYANLRRPIIFYVYDIDDYRDNLRGFYFDLEQKAPGPLCRTTDEVITELEKTDQGFTPSAAYEAFYDRFCYLEDGHASERVVEKVFDR
ncbi:CDP-glycerol glycerophosphotransferase family protein [Lentibacillus lipolyticus]|nr:CDP-glycerol glycerophosphotransferase family protein [Lentibacillus lipolyticus]